MVVRGHKELYNDILIIKLYKNGLSTSACVLYC